MIIFISSTHWPPWRTWCLAGFWTHVSRVRISGTACFFVCFFDFLIFLFIYLFYVFFLSLLLQCKFANLTLLSLLYYSLWCQGLQRLQRFDFYRIHILHQKFNDTQTILTQSFSPCLHAYTTCILLPKSTWFKLIHSADYILFQSFEIREYILNNQKILIDLDSCSR